MFVAAAVALKSISLPLSQRRNTEKIFQFIKRRQSLNEDHKDWIYMIAEVLLAMTLKASEKEG